MCAISYYLERAGIMATGISLVRENAESMQPPRSLWVSFPLGRPLGVPKDAAFQHRVIAACLALLDHKSGPVLEDFSEDAPPVDTEDSPACPIAFGQSSENKTWESRLTAELSALQPWYEMGRQRRDGRTLVGLCNDPMAVIITRLSEHLAQGTLPTEDLRWFKYAIEDAKLYYVEALTAQPGQYDEDQIYQTLWHQTEMGTALKEFYDRFARHPQLSGFNRILLPRSAVAETPQPKSD